MPTEDAPRERLRQAMDQRIADLRMLLREVADEAGVSEAHLRRVRNGTAPLKPRVIAGLEDALHWERGSIQAILDGGDPTPLGSTSQRQPSEPGTETPWWKTPPADLPEGFIWDGLSDQVMQVMHIKGLDFEERLFLKRATDGLLAQRSNPAAGNPARRGRRANG